MLFNPYIILTVFLVSIVCLQYLKKPHKGHVTVQKLISRALCSCFLFFFEAYLNYALGAKTAFVFLEKLGCIAFVLQ